MYATENEHKKENTMNEIQSKIQYKINGTCNEN